MNLPDSNPKTHVGRVYLAGAGPGDAGLLTIKTAQVLQQADVVIYDRLIHPAVLRMIPAAARTVYAGKEPHHRCISQDEINAMLVREALAGQIVVRLKGGDPYIFGRGGEEGLYLREHGIPFEVIPGVSALSAVPAYAGIPLTHRGLSAACLLVTGHNDPESDSNEIDWASAAKIPGTLVLFMAVHHLERITHILVACGKDAATPAAIIQNGTFADQRTIVGTLGDIADRAKEEKIGTPATVVIGPTVTLRDRLSWYEIRPLFGKRIAVTRSSDRASELTSLLLEQGADAVEIPTIEIHPPADPDALTEKLTHLNRYDWIFFTSRNTVDSVFTTLGSLGYDTRHLAPVKIASVGMATEEKLHDYGIHSDFTPERFTGEALAESFGEKYKPEGVRILLPQSDLAPDTVQCILQKHGAIVDRVEAYRNLPCTARLEVDPSSLDAITLTSGSTFTNLLERVGDTEMKRFTEHGIIVSIGPATSQAIQKHGYPVHVEAEEHTIPGLVNAIVRYFQSLM